MELWGPLGNIMASVVFIGAVAREYFPPELYDHVQGFIRRLAGIFSDYNSILIEEYDGIKVSELYESVQIYLSSRSSSSAKRLKLNKPKNAKDFAFSMAKNAKDFAFSMAKNEQILDVHGGTRVRWTFHCQEPRTQAFSWTREAGERRSYEMTFRGRDKGRVVEAYLPHVMAEAKRLQAKNRHRKIYTNRGEGRASYEGRTRLWTPVVLEHPASFDTLALDPALKRDIIHDLRKFSAGRDYYRKVGRAWKRGYLLYGPPGTGKSSMIAAIANFLEYDIYDLELTQVKSNTELRRLLIATTSKSIIVIEDIDCSLDLSDRLKTKKKKHKKRKRTTRKRQSKAEDADVDEEEEEENEDSRVTLSGVLNFTDGLWSCCGSERLIIFTTNHVDRLDPALLRPGRMDKRVRLSYCSFPAFQVLARNYLGVEAHPLFEEVGDLIDAARMTPAEISEELMKHSDDPTAALQNLIRVLQKAKERPSAVEDFDLDMTVDSEEDEFT